MRERICIEDSRRILMPFCTYPEGLLLCFSWRRVAVSHELAPPLLQGDGRDAVGLATGGTPVVPVNGRVLQGIDQRAGRPLLCEGLGQG